MTKFLYKIIGIFLFVLFISGQLVMANEETECVILLHGLARTESSLSKLEHHLKNQGYHVINLGYPSRKEKIQKLSEETINRSINECKKVNPARIHFVTHSMGGILVRYYLDVNRIDNLGRVVMLSPPNHGSEAVDKLKELFLFKWINGPAGEQLGTDKKSVPNMLGPPYYDAGIITGDRTINPILSMLIPGKDDGKVSVKSAKLTGMKDFLVVHRAHPFIMNDKDVMNQVICFLKNGAFDNSRD